MNAVLNATKKHIILFFILFPFIANAQYSEVGVWMGASNYLGDLVPPKQYFIENNFAAGISYQYNWTPRIGLRTHLIWGKISGDDQNSTNDSGRRSRNLHFKSPLFEWSVLGQINLLPFHPSRTKKPITPYGFLGVSLFHFNPQAQYNGEWVALQPLGTEGQGSTSFPDRQKYKRTQIAVPFGFGVKFFMAKHWNLSIEMGWRKTFTDYLDDVSQTYVNLETLRSENGLLAAELSNRTYDENRQQVELGGTPRGYAGKDWYIMMGVSVSYSIFKYYYFK